LRLRRAARAARGPLNADVRQRLGRQVVSTIYDASRKRRVHIFQRADGTFGFSEEQYLDDPREMCWTPIGRGSEARVDSADAALREARSRVAWLSAETM
jgi:hypothetical protein